MGRGRLVDLKGKSFGRWHVIGEHIRIGSRTYWPCRCECGTEKNIEAYSLKKHRTESCGCIRKEMTKERNSKKPKKQPKPISERNYKFIHKMNGTRFHRIWERYKSYGARGITVCNEWNDFVNFKNDMYESYLEHVEKYGEKDTTLDRVDVNGDYCKENCRWATNDEQSLNKRRNTIIMRESDKKLFTLRSFCIEHGIPYKAIQPKVQLGISVKEAIATYYRNKYLGG